MTATRVIGTDAVGQIVASVGLDNLLDELIERMGDIVDGLDEEQLSTFDRAGFHYSKPDLGLIEWMPAMDLGRLVSVKMVGYHPTNPVERRTPSIMASTSLYDTSSGRLLALCDATFMTALRTGAASALATDILAIPNATTLGMIGCGAQAVTQVHAISRVRPIELVLAFDSDVDVALSLRDRLPVSDDIVVEVIDADDLHRVMAQSDIICTATTTPVGARPVLRDSRHKPWLHVNAIGADFEGKIEIDLPILERATVFPDVVEQCLIEGECQQLERGTLGPDLVGLVQARAVHSAKRCGLTVFDSTGWAMHDLVAAELLVHHAVRLNAGVEVEIQPTPNDPYDPYEFVRPER